MSPLRVECGGWKNANHHPLQGLRSGQVAYGRAVKPVEPPAQAAVLASKPLVITLFLIAYDALYKRLTIKKHSKFCDGIGKHREHARVAVEPMPRNFTRGKEACQRHIAQRVAHDLQFGAWAAKMPPAAA